MPGYWRCFWPWALAFTPRPPNPPPTLYFGTPPDPVIYIWFLNWPLYAFSHHLLLLYTKLAFAPSGVSLAWKTNLLGLALPLSPLTARFGALNVYNSLMLAAPGLAGFGAYLAAFELTGLMLPALMAGLMFGFSGYELGQMLQHLNLSFSLPVPLSVWLVLAAGQRGWRGRTLVLPLGVLLAFEFGISQEVYASQMLFGALAIGLTAWAVPQARAPLTRLAPALLGALAVSLLLVSPLIFEMLRHFSDASRNVSPARNYAADLLNFILPTPLYWLGGQWFAPVSALFTGNLSEQSAYFGLPLIGLLLHLARTRRTMPRYRALLAFSLVTLICALGPRLQLLGEPISTAPWMLIGWLPFINAMLPVRFLLFAWLGAALLIALWLAEPGPGRARRYALLAVVALFLLPNRDTARNWTSLHTPNMLLDGTIPTGTHLLILPEDQLEMGYQYAASLRYPLVAQGYLSTGAPAQIAAWPFSSTLFTTKYQKYLPLVQPAPFADFLSVSGVQDVIITGNAADFAAPQSRAAELASLMQRAGWVAKRQDRDATLFTPPPASPPPSAAQIAADLAQPRTAQIGDGLQNWRVAQGLVARGAASLHANPTRLLAVARWFVPPTRPAPVSEGGYRTTLAMLLLVLALLAGLLVARDARRRHRPAPLAWGLAVFAGLIVALPLYLWTRRQR